MNEQKIDIEDTEVDLQILHTDHSYENFYYMIAITQFT